MAFVEKEIVTIIDLASGHFPGGGTEARIEGLRTSCHIANVGGPDQSQLELSIYGVSPDIVNGLVNVGADYLKSYLNGLTVLAGDKGGSLSLVFVGTIYTAFLDAQDPPNVALRIFASPGSFSRVVPAPALSLPGPVDVASVMGSLAGQMGLSFRNNGVKTVLHGRYFFGSAWEQAAAIAEAAGIVWNIDQGTLMISPPGTPLPDEPVLVSPETGLVGYPAFNQTQVLLTTIYNPEIKFQGQVRVQSSLLPACGVWVVGAIEYDLEAITPGGSWSQRLTCFTPGETAP